MLRVLRKRAGMAWFKRRRTLWAEPTSGDRSSAPPEAPATGPVQYVLGGAEADAAGVIPRAFPVIPRSPGESDDAHLARVTTAIEAIVARGGTHLIVPRRFANWLEDHPLVADHLVQHHQLIEADPDTGIVFALRTLSPFQFDLEVGGWRAETVDRLVLIADTRLIEPKAALRLRSPLPGPLTGRMTLKTERLRTLRVRFVVSRPGRSGTRTREVVLSLVRIGFVFHDLPYFAALFREDGSVLLEFDLKLARGGMLERIEFDSVEEDNWRLHPTFPGGTSIALPAVARAGARLELREWALGPTARVRKGPPYGIVAGGLPRPHRKATGRPRDAVIFSSWVPKQGLVLGEYYVKTLQRWHADSKIFVGVNHGSSPGWLNLLRESGLDVTVAVVGPSLTMPYDPTGFVAALDAFRHHDERFDLVWFGHNKGGDHLADRGYASARWMIERMFWSCRGDIERYFDDPVIGLYAPHYLMLLQEHLTQTEALCRMYAAPCAPLYAMAVSAHFVMRDESVREFCEHVAPAFFDRGPEPFGGDRFFFEMAMPNVPIMQGFEPYIEPGLGGTGVHPKITGVESILNDWRQNHAVVAFELEKWRQDPTNFQTRHRGHVQID